MRAGWAFLALGAAWLAGVEGASAVVGCETASGKLKLRPEACKPGKERVAFDTGGDPAGVWRWTSGPPLAGSADTFTEYVVLAPDGSGRLHRRQRSAGTLDCRPLNYARSLSASLTLDITNAGVAEVWRGRLTAPDALELSDASGATTQLERATAVDAAFECIGLEETKRFTGLPPPSSFSGLAFDGTQLWYSVEDALHAQPVDPGTGAAGTQVDLGPVWSHVHAMQGADFWAHCGCGGTGDAVRVSPGGAVTDEVKTAELGGPIALGAMARDEINAVLFVYGFSFEDLTYRLLQVRSDLEPDELAASVDVGFSVQGIAWDGSALWGVVNDKLFRIDPLTGTANATYVLPDDSVEWRGVAAANGELFVLGRSASNEGVIASVSVAP